MWKFHFYPQWMYRKTEQWLSNMEQQGYRLETVKCLFFFKFSHTRAKDVQYIFTYLFPKDYNIEYFNDVKTIKNFNGKKIITKGFCGPDIYRFDNKKVDLTHLKMRREEYLKKVFIKKIFFSLFMFLPAQICLYLNNYFIDRTVIFLLVLTIPFGFSLAYYIVGLCALRKIVQNNFGKETRKED